MVFRPEYIEALDLIARASDRVVEMGGMRPIVVGGAAVEFYTGGAIASGDFDLVAIRDDLLAHALAEQGFKRPTIGLLRGWVHPGLLIGVECVGDVLMDGKADRQKCRLVDVSGHRAEFTPLEDIIADRMAQHEADPMRDDMKGQAVAIYRLADELDRDYLEKRIRDETAGRLGVKELDRWLA